MDSLSIVDRRNIARAVARSGTFVNRTLVIDKTLRLPAYTTAGFAASAKRYGKRILDRVEKN